MRTTMDAAGRIVVPKVLRDSLGLTPGPVEIVADGAALRVEAVTAGELKRVGDLLVIPRDDDGVVLTDEMVRDLLESGRR